MLDLTVGLGGHAEAILKAMGPEGRFIGLDRDEEALRAAQARLKPFGDQVKLIHGNFGELQTHLEVIGGKVLDGILLDLGVSSFQLETPSRGFSFLREGPLDMRMDRRQTLTAAQIIHRSSPRELELLIRTFGQERYAGRIARAIVRNRPLTTTTALAQVIRKAVGGPFQARDRFRTAGRFRAEGRFRRGRIDVATRTFQAIRIAVNRELDWLPLGIRQAIQSLKPGGRLAVIAYHSLEDRIVKTIFREAQQEGFGEILTQKPIRPSQEELVRNPRSRSARLRIFQRL